jgi:hypothetical protein
MIAAAILGMVIVSFEILDRIITHIIRKNKQ